MGRLATTTLTLTLAFAAAAFSPHTANACQGRPVALATPLALSRPGPIVATGAPVTHDTSLRPRQIVQVEWKGQWWQGVVLASLPDGRVAIHYRGWGARWDEIVGRARLRLRGVVRRAPVRRNFGPGPIVSRGTAATAATHLFTGQSVEVRWQGRWWRGRVLSIGSGGTVRIRYVGWGSGWDEWVVRERLRVHAGVPT